MESSYTTTSLYLHQVLVEHIMHRQLLWLRLSWGLMQSLGGLWLSQLAQDELENGGIDGDQLRGVKGGLTRDKQGAHWRTQRTCMQPFWNLYCASAYSQSMLVCHEYALVCYCSMHPPAAFMQ